MRLGRIILTAVLVWQCAAAQEPQSAPPQAGDKAAAQQPDNTSSPSSKRDTFMRMPVFGDLLRDQKAIATGPARLRLQDSTWALPLAGLAAGMIVTDAQFSRHLNNTTSRIDNSSKLADYGVAGMAAAGGGLWLWGKMRGNDHERDTGYITGEAMGNAVLDVEALKFILGRQRPLDGNNLGFFRNGGQSMPSEHAAMAWAAAAVLAREYPGPLTKLFVYGGAAAISAARVTGKQHFPSDVLIGSALGYYVGNTVWRSHHESRDDAQYGEFVRAPERERQPSDMASPYVPLDSWVYDAFDRLSAMGYVHTAFEGLRPWTRMECARLLQESTELLSGDEDRAPEAVKLERALGDEFHREVGLLDGGENYDVGVDSVYSRFSNISGPVLTDGYHFGQSVINDFGRPFGEGANSVSGFTSHATAGPLTVYVRGEYQHAPGSPALSADARESIRRQDILPLSLTPPAVATRDTDRARLLEAYVALTTHNWQFSYGKQSLWWGPDRSGPMMFSNNAEPINMFRVSRVSPVELAGPLRWLGQMRSEFFLGQMDGYHFIFGFSGLIGNWDQKLAKQPWVNGQKVSFKPTDNLEFSFSRTTVFAGSVYPLTFSTFKNSLLSTTNPGAGKVNKPGDRRSAFDFTYRLPKLRNWMTFYADGFTDDEYSPVAYWDRSAWTAGLYMPQLPKIPKMDLRAEGIFTDLPIGGAVAHGFFYFNDTWRGGYTNNGDLLGSWIGRQGQGAQAWATYHFSARRSLQFEFRHQKVSAQYVPNGGTLADAGVHTDFELRKQLTLSGGVQYQRWDFPVVDTQRRSNVTTSIQFTWRPK